MNALLDAVRDLVKLAEHRRSAPSSGLIARFLATDGPEFRALEAALLAYDKETQ